MENVTWSVSGQINGGRRVEDEIQAPELATKQYLLHRFLARHKSLTDYWLSHNQGFNCKIKSGAVVDPAVKSPEKPRRGREGGPMVNWPAVYPDWRKRVSEFVEAVESDSAINASEGNLHVEVQTTFRGHEGSVDFAFYDSGNYEDSVDDVGLEWEKDDIWWHKGEGEPAHGKWTAKSLSDVLIRTLKASAKDENDPRIPIWARLAASTMKFLPNGNMAVEVSRERTHVVADESIKS